MPGSGEFDRAFPGVGNLTLPGWGGENRTGSVRFQIAFFLGGGGGGAPKLLKAINTCLDEMEHYRKSLQEKVFKRGSA